MKKTLITITLALAMILTLAIPAFAASEKITSDNGNATINVSGKYNTNYTDAPERLSVDIAWGAMEFTYTAAGDLTWNPETHEDDVTSNGGAWSASGNNITVTNHSNTAIDAVLAFAGASGITGVFKTTNDKAGENVNNNTLSLATAVGTPKEQAPKAQAFFFITEGTITADQSLGTITVTIKNK